MPSKPRTGQDEAGERRWARTSSRASPRTLPTAADEGGRTATSSSTPDGTTSRCRSLPFADETFDVAVFDSTLSHVSEPDRALAEVFRVLRPDGWLAAFDGDYATTTVALGDHDPLQVCVDAMMASSVNDRR
jgi:SAM-dependent methyltransferase